MPTAPRRRYLGDSRARMCTAPVAVARADAQLWHQRNAQRSLAPSQRVAHAALNREQAGGEQSSVILFAAHSPAQRVLTFRLAGCSRGGRPGRTRGRGCWSVCSPRVWGWWISSLSVMNLHPGQSIPHPKHAVKPSQVDAYFSLMLDPKGATPPAVAQQGFGSNHIMHVPLGRSQSQRESSTHTKI